MKIVIFAGTIPIAPFIDPVINGLAKRGYSMVVIGRKKRAYNYEANVEVIEMPKSKWGQIIYLGMNCFKVKISTLWSIYSSAESLKLFLFDLLFYIPILKVNPDRVHIQWASGIFRKGLLLDLFPNKVLISLRGTQINISPIVNPAKGKYFNATFPRLYKIHAVSKAIAKEALIYGANVQQLQIIYTSLEPHILEREIITKKPSQKLKIITVGRFHWVKGYQYLVDSLFILKKQKVDFELILIAGTNPLPEIAYAIELYGLRDNIKILDNMAHAKVLEYIEAADLMVLSSVSEGVANVVIEAMALGTPVISSNCGGMPEVIENGVNGYLFENRNSKDLAMKIKEFNELSEAERVLISHTAKRIVMNRFSQNEQLNAFEAFYT